ncbi:nose resistant to fluoxetine protein 6-like [Seminavis robusta]|uniref:Nose resistant to fluoxetine protein 6-like n=1 Tax=Seminavis robusta TaxID=568900 RepID=A0A9N8E3H9_9STRA|nr:nose resistant to fluoxetine protein 6-like [Seminavis robusta]|eukprot:Sro581_g170350.1 nose resistant to fluoxetine protein 6-like (905) ;mRNA; f:43022-45736
MVSEVDTPPLRDHDPDLVYLRNNAVRKLSLEDAENDNYWSTSLYSQPPFLTSSRCVHALRELFATPSVLAVATESSSHPTGLASVLAQPWLYAGGGLGNIEECPLQVCLAGAGTRRDSITFASVCVPFECHAEDLAAEDFPASLQLAATPVLQLVNHADDDDNPFELIDHPERNKPRDPYTNKDTVWFHTSPEQQRAWAEEYITLQTRIAKLNKFLQTGWTCGSYQVPFEAFPFGVPYLLACALLIGLALRGTLDRRQPQEQLSSEQESTSLPPKQKRETFLLIEAGPNNESNPLVWMSSLHRKSTGNKSGTSSPLAPTQETQSCASLSSDASSSDLPALPNDTENRVEQTSGLSNCNNDGATALKKRIQSNSEAATHTVAPSTVEGKPNPPQTLVECWNASYHWHKLCNTRHEATACLDGLRVFSILWVILGHVMAIESSSGGGYSNPVDFLPPNGLTTTFLGQLIFASRFAVDTFLVISGYLLVIVIARKAPSLCNNGKRRWSTFFQLIGLRLLRILPLYLLCIGFFTQVAPHMYLVGEENDGGGPFWYQWDSLLQPCRDSGWTNLLFINNFLPWEKSNTETCFYHSWYLAVDMQLFVLFGLPVTFFIFLANPTWGKRTTLALWCTSVLLTAYLSYVRHWSINTFDGLQVTRFDIEGYAKPHVRGQAYFAGMYVAMLQLTKNQRGAARPSAWKQSALMWCAILSLGVITFCTVTGAYARRPCQYSEAPVLNDDCGSLWSPWATFLYTATSRAIWSCCIGILMTLCLEGRGGWLNNFLSWPIWSPLAQLSFGTYLIHPIVIFVWLLGMREKNVYSLATFGMSLTSVCAVSFAFALVAGLLVEFPVASLIAMQIKKNQPRRPEANNNTNDSNQDAPVSIGRSDQETTRLVPTDHKEKVGYGAAS